MTTFRVYYSSIDHFAFIFGDKLPEVARLGETHTFIRSIELPVSDRPNGELETIYSTMQAEVWSPNGEAYDLIARSGASHTSMSVGDVIEVGGKHFAVASTGFTELH